MSPWGQGVSPILGKYHLQYGLRSRTLQQVFHQVTGTTNKMEKRNAYKHLISVANNLKFIINIYVNKDRSHTTLDIVRMRAQTPAA